ncbi:ABC transporter permease [Devosia sp.]|uniref:ABC transporter permease n=1 Tax=Devosia sp. TaxID=1871048 RepID=UPI002EF3D0DC
MPYGLKIALRYLTAGKAQTGLLIAGVAVGVFVFVFISALIGGLGLFLVQRTVGDIAHVSVEAPDREAGLLLPGGEGRILLAEQRAATRREQLRTAAAFLPLIEALPGVRAVSPQIVGNGFLVRGQQRAPVGVTGVEADKVSAIADIGGHLVAGSAALTNTTVLIGSTLARDIGVEVGQVVGLLSDRDIERPLLVGGIFELGLEALDSRAAFVSLAAARTLFELPQGISRIEIKLDDLDAADAYAARIAADTGLAATPWTAGNAQLLSGLRAQENSSNLIKAFALISIVIGVASALLLSTYRRRSEIGIMRAMGASRSFVVAVFVIQGALIGILGGLAGAGLGYLLLAPFPPPDLATAGDLPIDVRQGAYGLAIGLTALGAILASILPARAAARVDPVTVITQ